MQRLRLEAGDVASDERAVWRDLTTEAVSNDAPVPGQPRGGGWPDDEELPLDPDECVELAKGRGVMPRCRIDLDQLYQLPGQWEMSGSRIWFHRT